MHAEDIRARMQKAMGSVDAKTHLSDRVRSGWKQASKWPLGKEMDQGLGKMSHLAGHAVHVAEGMLQRAEHVVSGARKRTH